MRSFLMLLTLASSTVAMAATNYMPNYTTPINKVPTSTSAAPRKIIVSFFNPSLKDCQLHIGSAIFQAPAWKTVRLQLPVGAAVQMDSVLDNKVHNTLQISAADAERTISIR